MYIWGAGLGNTLVASLSSMAGLGLYWSHLGYIGAIWAKMDRYRLISDEILTQILFFHDLYAQKSHKSVFEPKTKSRPTTGTWCGCML